MRSNELFRARKRIVFSVLLLSICAALLVQAAQADPNSRADPFRRNQAAPQITGFTPTSGAPTTKVPITGTNFNGTNKVTFHGSSASYTVNSDTQITATVPTGATTGPISVTNSAGSATSSTTFSVTSGANPPTITSFSPSSGTASTSVTISGTSFTGASTVAFNGTNASYTVNSDTQIAATVPTGATSGPIQVTTGGGSATSTATFTVNSDPTGAIFVAPAGSDTTGDGSISKPFATLAKAQATMRLGGPQTTYLRSGSYALPAVTQNGVSFGLHLTSADNGETWSYYPPDGYDSAILDGGSTSSSTGIQELITIDGASHVTINGLQLQHFRWIGIGLHGGGGFYQLFPSATTTADGNTVTNNMIHDGSYDLTPVFGYGGGGFYGEGTMPNTTVTNNAVYNISAFGIEAQVGNAGQGGTVNSLQIANNAVLSTCRLENDCGAIYVQDTNTNSRGIVVTKNFIRDTGTSSYPALPIYLDDGVSGASVTNNVIAAGLYIWAFMIHGGSNNSISSNIVDLGPANNREILLYQGDGLTGMTGNSVKGNLIVSGGGGGGYEGKSFSAPPTIANNTYYQYAGAPVYPGGYSGLNGDASPNLANPKLSCWAYDLDAGSPVYNAPTWFNAFPRSWGPPGYTVPQTGTPPSQPHSC